MQSRLFLRLFFRFSLAVFAVVALVAAAPQEKPDDPRTKKRIAAKKVELATAEKLLQERNTAIQKLYRDLRDQWEKARATVDADMSRDLDRALAGPLTSAKETLDKLGTADRGRKRARTVFGRSLGTDLVRLENPLLVRVRSRVRTVALANLEEIGGDVARLESQAFVADLSRKLFETPFHVVWNEDLVASSSEIREYVEARKNTSDLATQLAVLEDPKLAYTVGAPEGMARIPAGSYVVEGAVGFKRKRRLARLDEFYIDLHEVTHEEYWKNFFAGITDDVKRDARLPKDKDKRPIWEQDPETGAWKPPGTLLSRPVTGVDCESALAYATTVGKRLPTEAEWAAAASGSAGGVALYPFGEVYVPGVCNDLAAKHDATVAVDSMSAGRSIFGVYHMAGNVKEWCATTGEGKDFEKTIPSGKNVVLRGGSYRSQKDGVSTRWRWVLPPFFSYEHDVGFRCAKSR